MRPDPYTGGGKGGPDPSRGEVMSLSETQPPLS